MRLLIDLSAYQSCQSGVFIYADRLIKGLRDNEAKNIFLLCNKNIFEEMRKRYPEFKCIKSNVNNEGRLNILKNSITWTKEINKIDCDAVVSPQFYSTYFFCNKPVFQTFHDLHALSVNGIKERLIYAFCLPIIIARSRKIITISDYVKKEILKKYVFFNRKKFHTIYNAVMICENKGKRIISQKYILYVSTLYKYKNVITLLKAFFLIKDEIEHKLIIIGKSPDQSWEKEAFPFIKQNKLDNRIIHISESVSDEALANYYANADLLVHPSTKEGFGFTPIEAAIHKIPVITNKDTALYETTKGLLNYYTPSTDEKELAEVMKKVLRHPQRMKELEKISDIFKTEYDYRSQAEKLYNYIISNI